MGIFSPDPPEPPPPIKPDPEPPKQSSEGKPSDAEKAVDKEGGKARRRAQRRGRSQTILTSLDSDQSALGKSRSGSNRKSKLGSA